MRIAWVLFGLVLVCSFARAEVFEGVEYKAPAGWDPQSSEGAIGFVPRDVTPETGMVLVLGPAESLAGGSFQAWFEEKLKEDLIGGAKVIQASEPKTLQQGSVKTMTLVRVVQDGEGVATIRMYHAVTDSQKAAIALAMAISEEATNKYAGALQSFFAGMRITGSAGSAPAPISSEQAGKGERIPEASVRNGVPQGMFVGRSLLTGKTVCLLFLPGGRITRAIPEGGLENLDWARHQTDHSGDCGTWQMQGSQLRIVWGDGGVHEGPLTVTSEGIQFYGKHYSRPATVSAAALAGRWESSRGTNLWGGEGVMLTQTLAIEPDGTFDWVAGGGGLVAGRAAYQENKNMHGKIQISSATITFVSADGRTESYTFVPLPGDPIVAFSLDSSMFTRVQE